MKQTASQNQWLEQRRAENKAREERGEPLLPEVDTSNPIFKPVAVPNRFESSLSRAQLSVYCKNLNRYAAVNFPKLFTTQSILD